MWKEEEEDVFVVVVVVVVVELLIFWYVSNHSCTGKISQALLNQHIWFSVGVRAEKYVDHNTSCWFLCNKMINSIHSKLQVKCVCWSCCIFILYMFYFDVFDLYHFEAHQFILFVYHVLGLNLLLLNWFLHLLQRAQGPEHQQGQQTSDDLPTAQHLNPEPNGGCLVLKVSDKLIRTVVKKNNILILIWFGFLKYLKEVKVSWSYTFFSELDEKKTSNMTQKMRLKQQCPLPNEKSQIA